MAPDAPQPAASTNVDPNEDDRGPVPAIPTHPVSARETIAASPSRRSRRPDERLRACRSPGRTDARLLHRLANELLDHRALWHGVLCGKRWNGVKRFRTYMDGNQMRYAENPERRALSIKETAATSGLSRPSLYRLIE